MEKNKPSIGEYIGATCGEKPALPIFTGDENERSGRVHMIGGRGVFLF